MDVINDELILISTGIGFLLSLISTLFLVVKHSNNANDVRKIILVGTCMISVVGGMHIHVWANISHKNLFREFKNGLSQDQRMKIFEKNIENSVMTKK